MPDNAPSVPLRLALEQHNTITALLNERGATYYTASERPSYGDVELWAYDDMDRLLVYATVGPLGDVGAFETMENALR